MSALAGAVGRLAARAGVRAALVTVEGGDRAAQRTAGRRAASAVGVATVGHADDGRPLWPDASTGSIAHTVDEAVAAVAASADFVALGVDIERSSALAVEDARLVLNAREQSYVDAHAVPAWAATLVWSAKESAFKAWSTATHGGLGTVDPVDIDVTVDEATRSLTVTAAAALGEVVAAFVPTSGFYDDVDGRVVTLMVLPVTARAAAG